MKKKIIIISIILFIVAVLLLGGIYKFVCNKGKVSQELEKTILAQTDFYEIVAKYPFEKLDKDNIIEQFIIAQVEQKKEEWQEGGQVYSAEKEAQEQFPDRPKMIYTLNINYEKFQSVEKETTSYLFRIGEYTGGANGREGVQTFTFNKDGLVEIESILDLAGYSLVDGNSKQNDIILSELIFEEAQKNIEQFPNKNLILEGLGLAYLKSDGLTLDHQKCNCDGWFFGSNLQNFIVSDQGLVFYFGKCGITICASGVVSVPLDWDILSPYFVKN